MTRSVAGCVSPHLGVSKLAWRNKFAGLFKLCRYLFWVMNNLCQNNLLSYTVIHYDCIFTNMLSQDLQDYIRITRQHMGESG